MPPRKAKQTESDKDGSQSPPASDKRVSSEGGPATKKRKLPLRGAAGAGGSGGGGHSLVDIEIPLPRKSRKSMTVEEIGDSQDEDELSAAEGEEGEKEEFKTSVERMKKKHIVFDEDGHDEFTTPSEWPTGDPLGSALAGRPEAQGDESEKKIEEGSEGDDDDDDAPPEAVSTHQAAAQSKKRVQAAAKAAEEQTAAKKRKRQERDTLFKKQAEGRKRQAGADALKGEADPSRIDEQEATRPEARKGKKPAMPQLLPPELLESDEEDEGGAALEVPAERKSKKIRFDSDRHPRDQRVGSTVYRITSDKTDARLPPKAHMTSRNLKDDMMARKRAPLRKTGFFVKT